MSTTKSRDTNTMVAEPEAASGIPAGRAASEALDPGVEMDFWRVNYMTRAYYKEGRSFGDYEAAYRYGLESSLARGGMTFEEAEKADLAKGWTAARGPSTLEWKDVRDASLDAWTRARREHSR